MATLLKQAISLAPTHIAALQQKAAAISAVHPHYTTAQINNLALKQVTQGVLGGLRQAQRTQAAIGNAAQLIAPLTNASSQGGAPTIVPGGNNLAGDSSGVSGGQLAGVDSSAAVTATSPASFWSSLSTTGKVAIVGGAALGVVLFIRHRHAAK